MNIKTVYPNIARSNKKIYLKLIKKQDNDYEYGKCFKKKLCSNLKMHILETFLIRDVITCYKTYLDLTRDSHFYGASGDTTCIEKENGHIYLSDGIFLSEEGKEPLRLKMSMKEFEKLMIVWGRRILIDDEEKRPSEVLIRYENEQFFFDIKD